MVSRVASPAVSFRILAFVAIMVMPVAALAYSNTGDAGVKKHGAGLVLFVSLQRQSMM
ncbi:hypothetical protein [Pararhizobium sp.]|uniref:hypothetical protein n=1 Tax=Pararhizobium sp. TaxID=1977563 RepID=UPI002726B6DA|nr:hypothetical protein [Pararhizobium sp.]MDO9418017.1 hypothetical protein [Pararhizobium sp.]